MVLDAPTLEPIFGHLKTMKTINFLFRTNGQLMALGSQN